MASNLESQGSQSIEDTEKKDVNPSLHRRAHDIQRKYREYCRFTFEELGVASYKETEELKKWALDFDITEKEIEEREKWYGLDYQKRIDSAKTLYKHFSSVVDNAINAKLISTDSRERWFQRLRDRNVGYKDKENWILKELPNYVQSWQAVANHRKKVLAEQSKASFIKGHPLFGILMNEDKFLALHHTKQRELVSGADAAYAAQERNLVQCHRIAEAKLRGAVLRGTLAQGKVGVWLERIFSSKATEKKIEEFIYGKGKTSLDALMENWASVRTRFTGLLKKATERGENTAARGFKIVTVNEFLSMHFIQRLRYVEEGEHRLTDSKNVEKEDKTVFLEIRHAIDVKDWLEATALISEAKMKQLDSSQWTRLKSMEQYVRQFSPKQMSEVETNSIDDAKSKMDELIGQLPSEMRDMCEKLVIGKDGNRNINQFRWIVYNNKWCREHGYLNQERARKGASEENQRLTAERAAKGKDIGRNDVLNGDTADTSFIRKDEYARYSPTLMHVGMGATTTLEEWLKREQNPKTLYWTTFCGFDNDGPKSDNWHNDLFYQLTQMRSLTRTINGAGYSYQGRNNALQAI